MRTAVIGLILSAWLLGALPGWAPVATAQSANANEAITYTTRQRVFAIPFTLDRRIAQPIEIHLYVSEDRGTTWQLYARQQPSARQFTFRASRDGEHWFASRTLAAGGATSSATDLQPELRVAVDTAQPQLQFTARPSNDGGVLSSWQASDPTLDASSLRIEYQEGIGKPWKPVPIDGPAQSGTQTTIQGQFAWQPETHSPTVNIRAAIQDRAGNQTVVNRRLLLPSVVARQNERANVARSIPQDPFMRRHQPSEGAVPWPSDNQPPSNVMAQRDNRSLATGHLSQDSANQRSPSRRLSSPPPAMVNMPKMPPKQLHAMDAERLPGALKQTPAMPVANRRDLPANAPESSRDDDFDPLRSKLANNGSSTSFDTSSLNAPEPNRVVLPPGERPRMTDAARFRLDYNVESVGDSGVAEVQLWASSDGGQTWQLWGDDEDLQSPFDVEVEEEGIFGFRVVIISRSGLSGRPPLAGDPADIWVGVDTTKPVAQLLSATYGQGAQAGKMILRWRAEDAFLGDRPISLLYSESADGPWEVIVSSLANHGEYVWPADPQLPRSVYLRLEVRDEAGNTGIHQLADLVRMDGLAPKARIRGVLPVPQMDREAFRLPRRR